MTKQKWGGLAAVLLTVLLLFLFYSKHILNADKLCYGVWGDGYKNFYTLAYYVNNDAGIHFTGMNYPFGENILFTDNQPLLAVSLKTLAKVFPAIKDHLHLIVTLLLFASLVFAAFVIYKLLTESGVTPWLAAVLSCFIALLSPNWDHFLALYSLAYTFYFPLVLYLTIKIIKGPAVTRYMITGVLVNLCMAFIHLYYLAIVLFFIAAVCVLLPLFFRKNMRDALTKAGALFVTVLVPLVAVKLYLFFTDGIADRPQNPWGYIEGAAHWYHIILHPASWVYALLKAIAPKFSASVNFGYEARTYLGIGTLLLLATGVVIHLKNALKKISVSTENKVWVILLLASVPLVFFAMAIPFSFKGCEALYDNLPASLRQFRAAARFSWMFYYTVTISGAIVLNYLFKNLYTSSKTIAYSLVTFFIVLWGIDVVTVNLFNTKNFATYATKLDETAYRKSFTEKLEAAGYKPASFQAIMPFPYYHIGSEKISFESGMNFFSMQVSLATGIPLLSCQMSRTSLAQSLKAVNLLGDPFIKKDIVALLPDKRPILILMDATHLSYAEKRLTEKAKYLFNFDGGDFMVLPLSAFSDSLVWAQDYAENNLPSFTRHADYLLKSDTNNVVYMGYNNQNTQTRLSGTGAGYSKEPTELYKGTLPAAKTNTDYEFSIWFFADSSTISLPIVSVRQMDTTGNNQIEAYEALAKFSTNNYNGWVKTTLGFKLANPGNIIVVKVNTPNAFYDNFLIRPSAATVITEFKSANNFWFNNYPIY